MCAGLLKKVSQEKVWTVVTRSGPVVPVTVSETEKVVKKSKNENLLTESHSYSFNIICIYTFIHTLAAHGFAVVILYTISLIFEIIITSFMSSVSSLQTLPYVLPCSASN